MELAPGVYETSLSDSATSFILGASEVQQVDPAPEVSVTDFDSDL